MILTLYIVKFSALSTFMHILVGPNLMTVFVTYMLTNGSVGVFEYTDLGN